jgi:hypothetical protein
MIAIFKCGKCGCNTQMYPQGIPVYDNVTVHHPVEEKTVVDGKVVITPKLMAVEEQHQRIYKMRRQNVFTGDIETVDVGLEDYGDVKKTVQVQVKLGDETMTKALCQKCYNKHVQPLAEKLWEVLAALRSF